MDLLPGLLFRDCVSPGDSSSSCGLLEENPVECLPVNITSSERIKVVQKKIRSRHRGDTKDIKTQ